MSIPSHSPYGAQPASPVPPSKSAMAIAGLVMGIVALVMSWVPIVNNLAFIFALLGVVFAIIGLVSISRGKKGGKGLAIAALVISIIAGVVVLGMQVMYSDAIDEMTSEPTVVASSSDGDSASNDAAADAASDAPADEADYTIANEKLTSDYGYAKVTGTLTNNTGADLDYVSVEYAFYDEDGAKIDTAYANTSSLKKDGAWKFEAGSLADADEVDSYECVEVTAW